MTSGRKALLKFCDRPADFSPQEQNAKPGAFLHS